MTASACDRILAILDAQPADQPFSAEVEAEIVQHLEECTACRSTYSAVVGVEAFLSCTDDELAAKIDEIVDPEEVRTRIRAGIDAAAHSSHRRTAAHRTRLWSMISLAAAACVLLAVFLWPQRQPFRSPLQIIAYQLPGASEWLDWESHGKTRASFPENTSVRLAPIAVDNRSLLVFDGREAPAIVPLTKLEHERWELRLGPRLASFIVIESPPDEERDALLDELGRALAHVSLEKGVLLAFADTGVQAQLTEIRGTGEAPKPPAWAEQVAEILTRHGLDAQGYALPIVTPEEAP